MNEDREDRLARREICSLVALHALLTRSPLNLSSELIPTSIALGGQMAEALEQANAKFEP